MVLNLNARPRNIQLSLKVLLVNKILTSLASPSSVSLSVLLVARRNRC